MYFDVSGKRLHFSRNKELKRWESFHCWHCLFSPLSPFSILLEHTGCLLKAFADMNSLRVQLYIVTFVPQYFNFMGNFLCPQ